MKRITLDLEDEIFKKLKLLAIVKNTNSSKIIRQSILQKILWEEQFIDFNNLMKIE